MSPCLVFHLSIPDSLDMTQIFVYGTLKRGQPNHYRMCDSSNGKAEFLATACTSQKYPLVIATKHNIPFLLNISGNGHRIQGEIYKVDEQMLKFLDDFEAVPTMYQRTPIIVEVMEVAKDLTAGSTIEVYVYSTQTYKPDWPSLPTYNSYNSYGAHGLEYISREAQDWCVEITAVNQLICWSLWSLGSTGWTLHAGPVVVIKQVYIYSQYAVLF